MPVSEAQKKAVDKYLKGFDEFKIRLPKGYKDKIKMHLAEGESLNAFFKRAVDDLLANDHLE